jgi:hypothetical protein
MLNRPHGARMRSTITTFAMLGSLVVIWHLVHWVARLIVTEFGIVAGLIACGVCFVTAVVMDRHGL